MIILQIILTVSFVLILFRLLVNPNSYQIKAWTKIFSVLFTVLAISVVLFPNSTNTIAHWVGVSKGADLLLYVLTLAFIYTVLNGYIRGKRDQQRLVQIVRKIALIEAQLDNKTAKKTT